MTVPVLESRPPVPEPRSTGMSRDRPTELSKPSLLAVLKRAVAGMTHFFRIRLCSLGRLGGRGVARRSGDGGG